jgi:hypothetical protein
MNDFSFAPLLAGGLLVGVLLSLEVGYRMSSRAAAADEDAHEGLGTTPCRGSTRAASSSSRRRTPSALRTSGSTCCLTPRNPSCDSCSGRYLATRFEAYRDEADGALAERMLAQGAGLQQQIWKRAVSASTSAPLPAVAINLLWAINEMIDVTTARLVARRTRLPSLILVLLVAVALASGVIAGYAKATRGRRCPWHTAMYPAAIAVTVQVVLDLDNPCFGLITLDATEQILQDLHDSLE